MAFDFRDDARQMPPEQMKGPTISAKTHLLVANFAAEKTGRHRFGGPLKLQFGGDVGGKPALHRLLTLDLSDPLLDFSIKGIAELPLVYGFTYDGCRLRYRVVADDEIELVEMRPLPTSPPEPNWPYAKYPRAFEEKRFSLKDVGTIKPGQVDHLTWQGLQEIDPKKGLVVIVPPSKQYGRSLWGESGDANLVQVVFEVDLRAGTVLAYNQCT